eukprot:Gb_08296 [translate_table: standard]
MSMWWLWLIIQPPIAEYFQLVAALFSFSSHLARSGNRSGCCNLKQDMASGEFKEVGMAGRGVRVVSGLNGKVQRRSFDSNEQIQRKGKFMGEICEDEINSGTQINEPRDVIREDDGDVSFSSYLNEKPSCIALKGSLGDDQSKIMENQTIADSSRIDAYVEPEPASEDESIPQNSHQSSFTGTSTVELDFVGVSSSSAKPVDSKLNSAICAYNKSQGGLEDRATLNAGSSYIKGLHSQTSCGKRIPIVGRLVKDSEISIFDAEKYFNAHDEKKGVGHNHNQMPAKISAVRADTRKGKTKNKGFFCDILDAHSFRPRISAVSSTDGSRAVFRSASFRGSTPASSSEASWNSQSGLLSNAGSVAAKLPSNYTKKTTAKWRIGRLGCKCPCSDKKSVETHDQLTETRRHIASISDSLHSSRLGSPLSSAKYSCTEPNSARRSLNSSNTEALIRIDGTGPGIKTLHEVDANKDDTVADNRDFQRKLTDARSLGTADGDFDAKDSSVTGGINLTGPVNAINHVRRASGQWDSARMRGQLDQDSEIPPYLVLKSEHYEAKRIYKGSGNRIPFENDEAFSFPILESPKSVNPTAKLEDMPRASLEVFGSPFPGTPDRLEDHIHRSSEFNKHSISLQTHSTDLHRRLTLISLEKARKSFTFNPNMGSESDQIVGSGLKYDQDEENNKINDAESDSSSDLFEIESFSTQGTGYPTYNFNRRGDSLESHMDDISSIQSSYAPSEAAAFNRSYNENSFHFQSVEETVTPSGQSSCYEPSEASIDWSITTGDTVDKASLGNFSSDYEDMRMMKRPVQNRHLSGLNKGYSKRKTGILLGCRGDKAVSVAASNSYKNAHRYRQQSRGSNIRRISYGSHDLALSRGLKLQAESRVTDIVSAAYAHRSSMKRSQSRSRSGHHPQQLH